MNVRSSAKTWHEGIGALDRLGLWEFREPLQVVQTMFSLPERATHLVHAHPSLLLECQSNAVAYHPCFVNQRGKAQQEPLDHVHDGG